MNQPMKLQVSPPGRYSLPIPHYLKADDTLERVALPSRSNLQKASFSISSQILERRKYILFLSSDLELISDKMSVTLPSEQEREMNSWQYYLAFLCFFCTVK